MTATTPEKLKEVYGRALEIVVIPENDAGDHYTNKDRKAKVAVSYLKYVKKNFPDDYGLIQYFKEEYEKHCFVGD